MKKYIIYFEVILLLALMSACKSTPTCTSKYVASEDKIKEIQTNIPFSHYDKDSKIRYDIFSNDSLIFLRFDVSDENTIHKILNLGVEIYFNKENKHKKSEGFIYPTPRSAQNLSGIQPQKGKPTQPKQNSSNDLQKRTRPDIILIHNNIEERFNLFSIESKLKINMDFNSEGNLSWQAIIPMSEFKIDSLPTELTVGILTGNNPEPEDNSKRENVNMQNNNNNYNNNNNSNSNSNTMYRQPYGNRPGGTQPMNANNYNKINEPVNIWFKLSLLPN
jgi:hypothetical protein